MKCHYRKRFVPDATIRARMDAADRRFEAEQRAKFPLLFPPVESPADPIVIRYVDLVPRVQPVGPVVDVALEPAQTVPGCRACLLGTGEIVELVALVCPTCGQDYTGGAQ